MTPAVTGCRVQEQDADDDEDLDAVVSRPCLESDDHRFDLKSSDIFSKFPCFF